MGAVWRVRCVLEQRVIEGGKEVQEKKCRMSVVEVLC